MHEFDNPGTYECWGRVPAYFLSEVLYSILLIMEREGNESSLVIYNALSFMGYVGEDQTDRQRLLKGGLLAPRLEWKLLKESEVVRV